MWNFHSYCAEMPVAVTVNEPHDFLHEWINGSNEDMDRLPRLRALAKTRA
jgi:hypothetical protein